MNGPKLTPDVLKTLAACMSYVLEAAGPQKEDDPKAFKRLLRADAWVQQTIAWTRVQKRKTR